MFSMISMKQLEMYLMQGSDMVLLDVRSPEEFMSGHLRGAVNIPMEELECRMDELSRDRPIIIYCGHGSKSLMAARFLDRMGFLVMAAAGGLASYRGNYYRSGQAPF